MASMTRRASRAGRPGFSESFSVSSALFKASPPSRLETDLLYRRPDDKDADVVVLLVHREEEETGARIRALGDRAPQRLAVLELQDRAAPGALGLVELAPRDEIPVPDVVRHVEQALHVLETNLERDPASLRGQRVEAGPARLEILGDPLVDRVVLHVHDDLVLQEGPPWGRLLPPVTRESYPRPPSRSKRPGSGRPASSNPLCRSRHASQEPQGAPAGDGS